MELNDLSQKIIYDSLMKSQHKFLLDFINVTDAPVPKSAPKSSWDFLKKKRLEGAFLMRAESDLAYLSIVRTELSGMLQTNKIDKTHLEILKKLIFGFVLGGIFTSGGNESDNKVFVHQRLAEEYGKLLPIFLETPNFSNPIELAMADIDADDKCSKSRIAILRHLSRILSSSKNQDFENSKFDGIAKNIGREVRFNLQLYLGFYN